MIDYSKKTAIVTGATGFIGSWLALELIKNNYDVTLIVRDKSRLIEEINQDSRFTILESSFEDLKESLFEKSKYDSFFHLAWGGVSTDLKNNIDIQLENIKNALSAIEIAKALHCERFIAAGTVAEYVFCEDVMDFSQKQTPNDMYGAAKVSAHYFLDVRARQLNQNFNWVVLPSTYGERRKDNNIITYTIKSLLKGVVPSYGNLCQMWDFLYVGEVVRAIRLIGEKGQSNKIYGIGSGDYRKLSEFITVIRDIINPELKLGIGDKPELSKKTFSSCIDISELTNDTEFIPNITFEEGIKKTIRYFMDSEDLYL